MKFQRWIFEQNGTQHSITSEYLYRECYGVWLGGICQSDGPNRPCQRIMHKRKEMILSRKTFYKKVY